jgi:ferredoxin-type protein NapF
MKSILRLKNLRAFSFFIAVALAIPVSWKGLSGFYVWLSPFITLNSVFSLKSFVWLNALALPVLLFVLFRKRWFCYYLCPVGLSCDVISRCSKHKTFTYNRFPDINKWLAIISLTAAIFGIPLFIIFDPLAIFNGFFTIFSGKKSIVALISLSACPLLLAIHLFFPSVWCTKLCPLGGLQLVIYDIKTHLNRIFKKEKQEVNTIDSGRRYFLISGIGLLAGLAVPKILKPLPEDILRPPAAVEPDLFYSLCCRCGNCSKACPTNIIVPQTDSANFLVWMTPEISFRSGYCLETCNICSRVCPSGAITLFSIKAKGQLYIGTAEVHLANCLLLNNKECVRCRESCKYDAIAFVAKENVFNVIPVVNTRKCIGCGACEVICPAGCIKIIPLSLNLNY